MPNLLNRLRLDLYEILLDSGTWSDDEVARDRLLSALVERSFTARECARGT